MPDNTLRRLARLERRQRHAGEGHDQSDRPEQTLVDRPTYAAAARDLLVACHLPVWDEGADADRWCRERGLSVEVIVVRLFTLLDEHRDLKGLGRAEVRNAVMGQPSAPDEYMAAWRRLHPDGLA
jgi:hypothetical protein